ncbi:hypothetical protein ACLS0R_08145 [Comamonas jiangduensis]|uniref:hypothetical protein n=1 Tax=Comamonas jiangduensis TaxID=1194168 RepID=UPI003BF86784
MNRSFQGDLYSYRTLDALIADKNKVFYNTVSNISNQLHLPSRWEIEYKIQEEDIISFDLIFIKSVRVRKKDGDYDYTPHFPRINLSFFNKEDQQILAIENIPSIRNPDKLYQPIESVINLILRKNHLICRISPIYENREVSELLNFYEKNIQSIEFELITPNMASISRGVQDDIKELAKSLNGVKTIIDVKADSESSINTKSEHLWNLISYIRQGGGKLAIRVKNSKKKIQLLTKTKEVKLDFENIRKEPTFNSSLIESFKDE